MDDNIRISTVRRDKRHGTRPHFHLDNELYYLEEGKSKMFVDTKLYSLSAGSLVFIKSGRIHKTLSGDNNSHLRTVVMFPDSLMDEMLDAGDGSLSFEAVDSVIIHVPELMRGGLKTMFRDIETELNASDCMSEIMLKCKISQILISMLRIYSKMSYEYRSDQDILDEVISSAIAYIRENYGSPLTLERVAGYIHMSPTYFSKKFKRETGVGFKEYVSKFRLREAEKLLRGSDCKSVTDVAARCGFGDSNYFATAFKAQYGVSPNKFRHLSER